MTASSAGGQPAFPRLRAPAGLLLRLRRLAGAAGSGQAVLVAGDGLAGVLAQVVPDMPPVGHLDRLRGAVAGRLGVGAGPVPADHLHLRVRPQPFPAVPASRSGSTSTGSPVSMSTSSVA